MLSCQKRNYPGLPRKSWKQSENKLSNQNGKKKNKTHTWDLEGDKLVQRLAKADALVDVELRHDGDAVQPYIKGLGCGKGERREEEEEEAVSKKKKKKSVSLLIIL